MGKIIRDMEILRKNNKDTLEIKNTVTEMENVFDGLMRRLDMAMKNDSLSLRVSQNEFPKWEEKREEWGKKPNLPTTEYLKTVKQLHEVWHMCNKNTREKLKILLSKKEPELEALENSLHISILQKMRKLFSEETTKNVIEQRFGKEIIMSVNHRSN